MPKQTVDFSVEDQRAHSSSMTNPGVTEETISGRVRMESGEYSVRVGTLPQQRYSEFQLARIPGRAYDTNFENLRLAIMARHRATGIRPATVLNFLPIPLVVCSPMTDLKVRIPAAPFGLDDEGEQMFSHHTWEQPAFEVMQRGDEKTRQPWDYPPIMLADTFAAEYASYGGVVVFEGFPDAETLQLPRIADMIEQSLTQMVEWLRSIVNEATAEWHTPNHSGSKNIVDKHRWAAMKLKDLGIIDNDPEWLPTSKQLQDVVKKCFSCGVTPNVGASKCVTCGTVLNPAKAYVDGLINEEDASLERLTRAEVIDLGVSDFVAETADEKKERVAAGRIRPMSIAQRRAYDAVSAGGQEPSAL